MKAPEQHLWSLDEIAAVLQDRMTPVAAGAVIGILLSEERAMHEEREETSRIERMISVIDKYDELVLLQQEGDENIMPDGILSAASEYLHNLRDVDLKDSLDAKARSLALYILATLEGPYNGGETLEEYLKSQPIQSQTIKALMKEFVVEKHGAEVWQDGYDEMDFIDLFDEMTYFDGENVIEIISKQPLIEDIREELLSQGFALRNRTGEKN